MLCFFSATGTGLTQVLLLKGDASGGHTGLFLHVELALKVAAPHGLNKSSVLFLEFLCFFKRIGRTDVFVEIVFCLVIEAFLNGIEKSWNFGFKL